MKERLVMPLVASRVVVGGEVIVLQAGEDAKLAGLGELQ